MSDQRRDRDLDARILDGVNARLAAVERFIPRTPHWRTSTEAAVRPKVKVLPGPRCGDAIAVPLPAPGAAPGCRARARRRGGRDAVRELE
jgi:hypothetical protein